MDEVTSGLLSDGLRLFADSYDELIADIAAKKDRLMDGEGRVRRGPCPARRQA